MSGNLSGGAARGTYWLHQALIRLGADSKILFNGTAPYTDDRLIKIGKTQGQQFLNRLSNRLGEWPKNFYQTNNTQQQFDNGLGGARYQQSEIYRQADLINLHHINGVVSVPSLRTIRKPLVWTLRSMWPLTGGCHYSFDCNKYQSSCSACPQLGSGSAYDLSRLNTAVKRASYPAHLQLVGVSDWISDCARSSALLTTFPIRTIYNGIDTSAFEAVEREVAIRSLELSPQPHYLLAIAQNFENRYKGFESLKKALHHLNRENCHLLLVGNVSGQQLIDLDFPHTSFGIVSDLSMLRTIYSAATIHVAPNRMETFGKTLAEAMACGTPVVCFDATGPREIVEHKISGYRARPYDPAALAEGINWILDLSQQVYDTMTKRARQQAAERFDSMIVGKQYLDLYQSILNHGI